MLLGSVLCAHILKFHRVLLLVFIIHSAEHLDRSLNLETHILQFWEIFSHYIFGQLPSLHSLLSLYPYHYLSIYYVPGSGINTSYMSH